MIITFFLTIVYNFVAGILSLVPSGHLPAQISSAILYFWGIGNSFSYVFPVATLLEALLLVVGFELALLVWHILNWLLRKIPGIQ